MRFKIRLSNVACITSAVVLVGERSTVLIIIPPLCYTTRVPATIDVCVTGTKPTIHKNVGCSERSYPPYVRKLNNQIKELQILPYQNDQNSSYRHPLKQIVGQTHQAF
jgi:hypothetical protein